jgi:hypothetical protein
MLSEVALGPEVFRIDEYGGPDEPLAEVCLAQFRALLDDCVARDLRSGDWHTHVVGQQNLHRKGKELLVKLKQQKRLLPFAPVLQSTPATDRDWENEAVSSHGQIPLTGMIFGAEAKRLRFATDSLVSCPQKLGTAPFWTSRACSRRINRRVQDYQSLLDLVLRHATWIAFIDPHLDLSDARYRDFHELLRPLAGRAPMPLIEIHRVAWIGDGRDRRDRSADIKPLFSQNLEPHLRAFGLKVEVFLWDDFHDRFLASNLIGLSWSNGFDTTAAPSASVTIARLSRNDAAELQKEFSQNSPKHELKDKFTIG